MEISVELGGARSFIEFKGSSLAVKGDLMKLSDRGTWEIIITANDTSFSEETIVHKKSIYLRVVDPLPAKAKEKSEKVVEKPSETVEIKEEEFKG